MYIYNIIYIYIYIYINIIHAHARAHTHAHAHILHHLRPCSTTRPRPVTQTWSPPPAPVPRRYVTTSPKCQKRPTIVAKETYCSFKRDLL